FRGIVGARKPPTVSSEPKRGRGLGRPARGFQTSLVVLFKVPPVQFNFAGTPLRLIAGVLMLPPLRFTMLPAVLNRTSSPVESAPVPLTLMIPVPVAPPPDEPPT